MINLDQYKKICVACDSILDSASDIDEVVSIPLLHVLREHPQCLKIYSSIFNEDENYKSNPQNLLKKFLALVKSTFFDSKLYNFPSCIDNSSSSLIIVSHITNPNQCSNIEDEYFGTLNQSLRKFSQIKPIILLINQTSVSSKKLSKALSKNNIDRIVIPKSSGFFNEIKLLYRLVKSVKSFLNGCQSKDPVDSSILNLLSKPGIILSGMSALRIGFFVEQIVSSYNSNHIITTYEGHSRERIIFSSARKSNKNIFCYGYQHTILNKYQHALTRNINRKYNPNHIFCCGAITQQNLTSRSSLDGVGITILGSPKGAYADFPSKLIDSQKKITFLFLPEGIESEYKIFYKFIILCAKSFPNYNFVWRSHPLLDVENLYFFDKKMLPQNIYISKNQFDDDLKLSEIAIYRGTNAIVRAVMANLIPIYLKKRGEIGIDIMSGIKINRIESITDLKSILDNQELLKNNKSTIQFCKDYFRPMNWKSFANKLNKNGD